MRLVLLVPLMLALLQLGDTYTEDRRRCERTEFRCRDGSCIDDRRFCDNRRDCPDGSDEARCEIGPPRVVVLPSPQQRVNKGDSAQMQCRPVPGTSRPDVITWSRADGRPMPDTAEVLSDGVVRFVRVTSDEEGNYVCTASNAVGEETATASIRMLLPPVIRLLQPTTYRVMEGQKVELTCSASGIPIPSVSWSDEHSWSGLRGVPGRVTGVYEAVTLQDAGVHTCTAKNDAGTTIERLRLVVVPDSPGTPPVIRLEQPLKYRVLEGQKVELTCSASGDPTPSVSWSGGGHWSGEMGVPGRVTVVYFAVTLSDTGLHTCTATNSAGTAEVWLRLKVYREECLPGLPGPPGFIPLPLPPGCPPGPATLPGTNTGCRPGPPGGPSFVPIGCDPHSHSIGPVPPQPSPSTAGRTPPVIRLEPPSPYRVAMGKEVELTCSASGDPTPSVSWSSGGHWTAQTGAPGRVTGVYSAVTFSDAGLHTCTATNSAGTVVKQLRLVVLNCEPGPPGPPGSIPPTLPPGCPPGDTLQTFPYHGCRRGPPGGPTYIPIGCDPNDSSTWHP